MTGIAFPRAAPASPNHSVRTASPRKPHYHICNALLLFRNKFQPSFLVYRRGLCPATNICTPNYVYTINQNVFNSHYVDFWFFKFFFGNVQVTIFWTSWWTYICRSMIISLIQIPKIRLAGSKDMHIINTS